MHSKNHDHSEFSLSDLQRAIDGKTKPVGSLGRIEELAFQIGAVQETTTPRMQQCQLTIIAADHGVARSGVSAYPQEVTAQMVLNFLAGGAAANSFADTLGVDVRVVDAGVAGDAIQHSDLISRRIGAGTENFAKTSAMSSSQRELALNYGRELPSSDNLDAVCFGEMGIGNTSAATMIGHKLLGLPIRDLVGRGTGLDDAGLANKSALLNTAANRVPGVLSVDEVLTEYGGFEIVIMVGAMLQAATDGKLIVVDGFIASAAAAAAIAYEPASKTNMVFAHFSAEAGHRYVVDALGVRPLLNLGLRLGEGTGALLAWPLLQCAAAMLCDMASFESAGVSGPA